MKKRQISPRIDCPHCRASAHAYDSIMIDRLTREIRYVCGDVDCNHTFVAQLGIFRTVRPSLKPDPTVRLPLGEWRARPANDDNRHPANDDDAPPAAAVEPDPMTG